MQIKVRHMLSSLRAFAIIIPISEVEANGGVGEEEAILRHLGNPPQIVLIMPAKTPGEARTFVRG